MLICIFFNIFIFLGLIEERFLQMHIYFLSALFFQVKLAVHENKPFWFHVVLYFFFCSQAEDNEVMDVTEEPEEPEMSEDGAIWGGWCPVATSSTAIRVTGKFCCWIFKVDTGILWYYILILLVVCLLDWERQEMYDVMMQLRQQLYWLSHTSLVSNSVSGFIPSPSKHRKD